MSRNPREYFDGTGTKPVAALEVLWRTQAAQYELSGVPTHNPEQTQNTDAVEGGVALALDG